MLKKNLKVTIDGGQKSKTPRTYNCNITITDYRDLEVDISTDLGWQGMFINGEAVRRNDKCSAYSYLIADWIGMSDVKSLGDEITLKDDHGTLTL